MIDLHTHILPEIDDGARTWSEAVAMCRAAASDGCRVLVATPHQRHPHWWNDDLQHLERLRRELQSRLGPHPKIVLGAEVRADAGILAAIDSLEPANTSFGAPRAGSSRTATGEVIQRLATSRYLLIEFGREGGPDPESVVHEMSVAGWTPVLAHPECIPWLAHDLPRLANLVKLGALLQITAMSVLGDFGRDPRDAAWNLLQAELVHVMASDCHGLERRPPGLSRAAGVVERRWGSELAKAITTTNPKAIISDRAVDVAA